MKLDDFLKRKKVRCINRDNHGYLTENKVYDVIGAVFGRLKIRNDNGDTIWYDMTCFKLVIESAENPLQGVELTPEFEAVEPKFKAGDKVYCILLKPKIFTTLGVDSDNTAHFGESGKYGYKWWSFKNLCHANPENYAILSKLYPHIEFEQPAKELKGSDLARALIKKGWVGFNCLCGNSGDENAITDTIVIGINNDGKFTTIDGRLFSNAIPMKGWLPLKAQEASSSHKAVLDE